jgi:hypothetical protein
MTAPARIASSLTQSHLGIQGTSLNTMVIYIVTTPWSIDEIPRDATYW